MCEDTMKLFCRSHNLKNLIDEPTSFKNMETPICSYKQISFFSTIIGDRGFIRFSPIDNDNHEYLLSKTNT